jgi:hypothetical protein
MMEDGEKVSAVMGTQGRPILPRSKIIFSRGSVPMEDEARLCSTQPTYNVGQPDDDDQVCSYLMGHESNLGPLGLMLLEERRSMFGRETPC